MAGAARDISIVYGTTTVGGSSAIYHLHDVHEIESDYDTGRIRFSVIVTADASVGPAKADLESDFVSNATAFEAAFRTPRQKLTVTLGGSAILTWDPAEAQNTGFRAEPIVRKPGSREYDSKISRLYEVTVVVELPGDLSGQDGRRDSKIRMRQGPSGQRELIVTGAYSAIAGKNARDAYEAVIDAYIDGIKTVLGGNWDDIVAREYDQEEQDKALTFRYEGREQIFKQDSSGGQVAALVNPRIACVFRTKAPGDSIQATKRAREVTVLYDADVDKSESTDLKSVWDNTVLPLLVQYVRDWTGASQVALVDSGPGPEPTANRIQATVQMRVYGGEPIIESWASTTVSDSKGILFDEMWDGTPYAALLRQGAGRKLRITRSRVRRLGSPKNVGGGGGRRGVGGGGGAGGGAGSPLLGLEDTLDAAGSALGINLGGVSGGGGLGFPQGINGLRFVQPGQGRAGGGGGAPGGGGAGGGGGGSGWTVILDEVTETPMYVGEPPYQVLVTVEEIHKIERFSTSPRGGGGGTGQPFGGGPRGRGSVVGGRTPGE